LKKIKHNVYSIEVPQQYKNNAKTNAKIALEYELVLYDPFKE